MCPTLAALRVCSEADCCGTLWRSINSNIIYYLSTNKKGNTMTLQEAIDARHSVRAYKDQPLADDVVKALEERISDINRDGRLHIQLILNEKKAFKGPITR